jgi:hypothetical protein
VELNTVNLWLGICAVIISWLVISFGYFYRAKRTEEITAEIARDVKSIMPKMVEYGLLLTQTKERQDAHEKRCDQNNDRLDEHLNRIYGELKDHRK